MTTLQKTVVAATIAALAGAGIYEARQASQLREQNQALQQQQAPLIAQVEAWQQSLLDATNQLTALRDENGRLNRNTGELVKLRAEVSQIRASRKQEEQLLQSPQNPPSRVQKLPDAIDQLRIQLIGEKANYLENLKRATELAAELQVPIEYTTNSYSAEVAAQSHLAVYKPYFNALKKSEEHQRMRDLLAKKILIELADFDPDSN